MAKWFGVIGYATQRETAPGVFRDMIETRRYYGDLLKNTHRVENGEGLNKNIRLGNELRILADQFAFQNSQNIRFVEFMGTKWEVVSVTIEYPALILSFGGIYNAQEAGVP